MPILSAIAAASAKAYGFVANVLKIITDNFNRSNGSLGTSITGDVWNSTRGTWSISSNQATSSDTASNYPMATLIGSGTNITASVETTNNGLGVAFWVTDANNWWASTTDSNSSTSCSTCYQTCYQTCYYLCYQTCYETCYSCSSGCLSGTSCVDCDTLQTIGSATPYNCNPFSCNPYACNPYSCNPYSCNPYSCNCVTTYSYALRLLQSLSGTVSTPTSDISISSSPAVIYVSTSGNTITAKAFSDNAMTTQLGSTLTYSPSSPTKGTSLGIIKTPVSYNQGTNVDNFSATTQ